MYLIRPVIKAKLKICTQLFHSPSVSVDVIEQNKLSAKFVYLYKMNGFHKALVMEKTRYDVRTVSLRTSIPACFDVVDQR